MSQIRYMAAFPFRGFWNSSSTRCWTIGAPSHDCMSSSTFSMATPSLLSSASKMLSNCWEHSSRNAPTLLLSKTTCRRSQLLRVWQL